MPRGWLRKSPDIRASAEPAAQDRAVCSGPIASADARGPTVRQARDISARRAPACVRPSWALPQSPGQQASTNEASSRCSWLAGPENLVERLLHPALLVGGCDAVDDLLLAEHVHHAGRIGGDVRTRRQPTLAGEKGLAFVAEHVVGGKQRGLGMRRLGIDADRAEGERDWIERPEIGRHAGELEIDGQWNVIVERDPVLAGAHLAREIEMAI